jgi:hypothetical protein
MILKRYIIFSVSLQDELSYKYDGTTSKRIFFSQEVKTYPFSGSLAFQFLRSGFWHLPDILFSQITYAQSQHLPPQ